MNPVLTYIKSRGLAPLPIVPVVLRYHRALGYWHTAEGKNRPELLGTFPAMLARVEHLRYGLVTIHRTYLRADGTGKADVPSPKKLTKPIFDGAVNGAAIRLFPACERLALAEGIETALAVHLASDWPVWACISAGGLARVEIPATVREVLIAADHDQAGLKAADTLAHRLIDAGVRVRMAKPPTLGTDWLDVWSEEQKVVGNEH